MKGPGSRTSFHEDAGTTKLQNKTGKKRKEAVGCPVLDGRVPEGQSEVNAWRKNLKLAKAVISYSRNRGAGWRSMTQVILDTWTLKKGEFLCVESTSKRLATLMVNLLGPKPGYNVRNLSPI